MVTTEADKLLRESREAVRTAIHNLSRFTCEDSLWGVDDYSDNTVENDIPDAIKLLLDVQKLIGR